MKKVAFYTLGCKVNQYETDAMKKMFIERGYTIVDFLEVADIYIINTCTVTAMSDKKSRQMVNRAKRVNASAKVIITGCMAEELKQQNIVLKDVDLVVGNEDRKNIVKIIENEFSENIDVNSCKEFWEPGNVFLSEHTRAYIKIEDGCNNFCTYCIIPYVRGRVRSRDINNIVEEVKNVVEKGVREVVIIGIHIASYGKDLDGITLTDVIERINALNGDFRIRLGSIEPVYINEETVERLKNCDKLCKHFHLSIQSLNNETLKRMNRHYTVEELKDKIKLLRDNFNLVAITTDIIVGFPGETAEEFESTYETLKEIKLSKTHVFPYSVRQGTVAEKMDGQIPEETKNIRASRLIELSDAQENEFKKQFIGQKMREILENREKDGLRIGHNEEYIDVLVDADVGDVVEVIGTKENLKIR